MPVPTYCPRCGAAASLSEHPDCVRHLELEPPRYCAECGRRMVVEVTPLSWKATCSRHGEQREPAEG
jgi:hypothetical protein